MKRLTFFLTIGLTAIAPIVWGSTYIVTSELLPANAPLLAATLRALPAGFLLILMTRVLPVGKWWWRLVVLSFLNISFFFYCLFFAATHLPGGMAALVMSIQPILIMSLSLFLLKESVNIRQVLACIVSIFSVGLLLINNQAALNINGLLMGLLGTISMALGMVMTKRWGRPENMVLLNFTGWQLFFGGLTLLPFAWYFEGFPEQLNTQNIIGYVYLSLVGAMLAYSLWFNGIAKLPTITVSFLGFLSSVSAVLLGHFILDQFLTTTQWLGAFGILASILFATPKLLKGKI
jgi:probable blue pigment (indigoidine) exporter